MMINILHLLWIVPISIFSGYFIAALMCAASDRDNCNKDE